jgi:Kef-type K+ transport system membrane component KefB
MRELKPMEVDLAKIVLAGTVLYAVAAVILLALHTSLTNDGHGRWPWIAVSGVGLGLLGLYYLKRRDRAIARDAAAARGAQAADGPSDD